MMITYLPPIIIILVSRCLSLILSWKIILLLTGSTFFCTIVPVSSLEAERKEHRTTEHKSKQRRTIQPNAIKKSAIVLCIDLILCLRLLVYKFSMAWTNNLSTSSRSQEVNIAENLPASISFVCVLSSSMKEATGVLPRVITNTSPVLLDTFQRPGSRS